VLHVARHLFMPADLQANVRAQGDSAHEGERESISRTSPFRENRGKFACVFFHRSASWSPCRLRQTERKPVSRAQSPTNLRTEQSPCKRTYLQWPSVIVS